MDGTLVRNTDSVRFLCTLNNHQEKLEEIERLEARGDISWIDADHLKAELIKGLDPGEAMRKFGDYAVLIHNAGAVLKYLADRLVKSVLITSGPSHMAEVVGAGLGFNAVYGSQYEIKDRRFTGRITSHLDAVGKLACLEDFCEKHGIVIDHCIAVGDGESDIEIFRSCGKSIGVNCSEALRREATECVSTEDLFDLVGILESWLG
jgi:phosphoserine phosphatase